MGWPERPLDPGGGAAAQLAYKMVELRHQAGLSLNELAKRTNYTVSALSLATDEKKASSWAVTIAYITACERAIGEASDPESWKRLWKAANSCGSRRRAPTRGVV